MGKAPQRVPKLRTDVVSFHEVTQPSHSQPYGIHLREFVNHSGRETYLRQVSITREWGDYVALLGLVNILDTLDIPVAVVSSFGEGLPIIYPGNHRQETVDFDSIALVSHEAETDFHSLQQMDAKTTDILEELKLKYGQGRITEDQICKKCGKIDSYSPKASMRGAMVFCRSMPTTVCFVKIV